MIVVNAFGGLDSVVGIATTLHAGRSEGRMPVGQDIVLCSKTPRPALAPTQRTIQWVPGLFPGGDTGGA